MFIKFSNSEIDQTEEYKFWRYVTNSLVMDSPLARSDLIDQYLYENYELVIEEFVIGNRYGPLHLRSVKCPEITEIFLRLKYAPMPQRYNYL